MGKKKIVTIGGGGGHSAVVRAIKGLDIELTALCNTVDDGGSTGRLMQEYGVCSMGDIRKVISALSSNKEKIFEYRFETGELKGHTLGNLILTGLQLSQGFYETAARLAGELLQIKHQVAPITQTSPILHARTITGKEIVGQSAIVTHIRTHIDEPYETIWVEPSDVQLSAVARAALSEADIIIVCMGDLYSSVGPIFCIKEFQELWSKLSAKIVWITNLVAPLGHIHYQTTSGALKFLQALLPTFEPDIIIEDNNELSEQKKKILQDQGYIITKQDMESSDHTQVMRVDSLDQNFVPIKIAGDIIERSPIRRDFEKLGNILKNIIYG